MDLQKLMSTTPENLAKLQLEELKKHTIAVLNIIITFIEEDNYDEVISMIRESPAGDGYGMDNYYINFSYSNKETQDINDIVCKLKNLYEIVNKK